MKISELIDNADELLSPLTIPIKKFKFDRAAGPDGCKHIDGTNKEEFKDLPATQMNSKPDKNPFEL